MSQNELRGGTPEITIEQPPAAGTTSLASVKTQTLIDALQGDQHVICVKGNAVDVAKADKSRTAADVVFVKVYCENASDPSTHFEPGVNDMFMVTKPDSAGSFEIAYVPEANAADTEYRLIVYALFLGTTGKISSQTWNFRTASSLGSATNCEASASEDITQEIAFPLTQQLLESRSEVDDLKDEIDRLKCENEELKKRCPETSESQS